MADIPDLVQRLSRSSTAVSDPELRVGLLRETVRGLDAEGLADLMTVVLLTSRPLRPEHGDLMLALGVALADPLLDEVRRDAADIAAFRGQHDVARVLRKHELRESEVPPKVPDFGRGRTLTLGERKSVARTQDRRLIVKALHDPHPDVIRILLLNPRVTEEDVVRIAAMRPTDPAILRVIFRTVKWVIRYRVRRTLIYNPHTPLDIALCLTPHLNEQDTKAVADAGSIRSEIREACRTNLDGAPLWH